MSCRKGRNGQQKGSSDARWDREIKLSDRVYTIRGKRVATQHRRTRYDPDQSRSRYTGMDLREIRAIRGVGRPMKFTLETRL